VSNFDIIVLVYNIYSFANSFSFDWCCAEYQEKESLLLHLALYKRFLGSRGLLQMNSCAMNFIHYLYSFSCLGNY